jgi:hypothetical protein
VPRRVLIALAAALGCSSVDPGRVPDDAAAPTPDARGPAQDRVNRDTAEEPSSATCPAATPAREAGNDGQVTFPVVFRAAGEPLRLGQELVRSDGVREKFSLVRVFLSQPVLIDGRGGRVPAQIVDGQGRPLPYGVLLVDPEKAPSLSLLAPAGRYTGLALGVGLPAACNAGDPTRRVYPLNADGEMYWTWGSQYLFVRLDGFVRATGSDAWSPFLMHMGFDPLYRTARLSGAITAGRQLTGPTIVFDIDALIRPDGPGAAPADGAPTPDWVADHISAGAVLSFE